MTRPGPGAIRALGAVAAIALLIPLAPGLLWGVLGMVLAVAALSLHEALSLRRLRVDAERRDSQVLALGVTEVVAVDVRCDARWPVRLLVRQTWPRLLERPASVERGVLRPGEILPLRFEVRGVERGRVQVAPLHLCLTRWGLAERILPAGRSSAIKVFPDLRAVARLHAQLNRFALRGLGTRMAPQLGKGREFDRLREYVRGDEFRDLAWKASARHGKLIVREFRLDRSQDVLVCLDAGHRMATRAVGLSRLDHAVNGAVLLGYVCHRMEDRVGILSFNNDVSLGPAPGRGGSHIRRYTDFAASTRATPAHSDYMELAAELRRGRRQRSLIVIFTALAMVDPQPLLRAVRALSPPHLVLVVVLEDVELRAVAHMRPGSRGELARTLVAQDLWASHEHTVRSLRRLGALVVGSTPSDVGVAAMNAYIDVKRRQIL